MNFNTELESILKNQRDMPRMNNTIFKLGNIFKNRIVTLKGGIKKFENTSIGKFPKGNREGNKCKDGSEDTYLDKSEVPKKILDIINTN